jgi:hypothetical protein
MESIMRGLLICLCALFTVACGEGDNPNFTGGPLPVTNAERALGYPEGPYGQDEGDVLPNWSFVDVESRAVDLQNIRSSTEARYLILLPSAEWMESARTLLSRAEELDDLGRDDVLFLSAVFEDAAQQPPSVADAVNWQNTYAVRWMVVSEEASQFRLAWRENMRAVVLIDMDTMTILPLDSRPTFKNILLP